MNQFDYGDLVLFTAYSGMTMPQELRDMNGTKFRVSRRVLGGAAYELIGCESKYGIPYTIAEDWLVPVREGKK